IIPAESGELASGLSGEGRMAEPENIIKFIESDLLSTLPLAGKHFLVNAGPTYEAIDPVRFIGNRSSGKTGIAIADELAAQGASVTLVLGPSAYSPKNKNVNLKRVESAQEMYEACTKVYDQCDVAILTAAVADYRPSAASDIKIKKKENEMSLELTKTNDILAELGRKKTKQILVGFALETNDTLDYARKKLEAKNLDMVVANTTSEKNPAFGADFNTVTIIDKHNNLVNFEFKSKQEIAIDVINHIKAHFLTIK
ncbi:MAG TPA: bifunctional phosphopantothenoylcysteine decarboxylase/phosphopantothenate--cysteine ligase CoaBC, partial [Bacteroidia bacterium]|nr:bifunctional phosphopantothenoylcysteine decarboxylase/phosphopantothenate--cysteine ligase CoaBC [Bacteroidia bacterium]